MARKARKAKKAKKFVSAYDYEKAYTRRSDRNRADRAEKKARKFSQQQAMTRETRKYQQSLIDAKTKKTKYGAIAGGAVGVTAASKGADIGSKFIPQSSQSVTNDKLEEDKTTNNSRPKPYDTSGVSSEVGSDEFGNWIN